MSLIRRLEPEHVLLVHGERRKMAYLKRAIMRDIGIPVFDPPNGTAVTLPVSVRVPVVVPDSMLDAQRETLATDARAAAAAADTELADSKRRRGEDADGESFVLRGALLSTTGNDGRVHVRAAEWPRGTASNADTADADRTLWMETTVAAGALDTDGVLACVQTIDASASVAANESNTVRTSDGICVRLADGCVVRWPAKLHERGEQIVAALKNK